MQYFLDRLVAKASETFHVKEKLKNAMAKGERTPDITISRDPGSGGRVVARRVARLLGWDLLDKQILSKLADSLGIPEREFAKIDEHTRNWFSDSIHSIINPNYVSDIRYINHLKKLLVKSCENHDVVIVGRGANLIIPAEKCLRVRITASFDVRVRNTYKHEKKKTLEQAAEWVQKIERKRSNFIKQYFGVNPYNPWHYDVIINTDHYTINQASDIVIAAYFAKFPHERKRLEARLK